MKATLTIASVLTAVVAMTGVASAQVVANPAVLAGFGGFGYGGYGYHHASTLEEGWQRGLADLTRSQGERNYFNSLAAVNVQEAYSRYLQNRQKAVDAYFYMKQANRAAREAMASQRLTYDQYVALAKKVAPEPLTQQQYDRTIGRLNWPAALTTPEFDFQREALDKAFAERSPSDFGPATAFYNHVRQMAGEMQLVLKARIDDMDPAQYMTAKNFLQSVGYEAQQPVMVRSLAMAE